MSELVGKSIALMFGASFFFVLPAVMIWGWARWGKRKEERRASLFSCIGFALATSSGLLAIGSFLYSVAIGGFPFYDHRLLKIYVWGLLLSLGGILFALLGLVRPNPLRWHAPICSVAMLVFWFLMAVGE